MAECQVFRNDDSGVIERVEAPNGQPSTLYNTLQDLVKDKEQALRLWAQVYTGSFKNWFGEWERKQGSKVVDENGEPLLVYHGTNKSFNIFKRNYDSFGFDGGIYFTSNKDYLEELTNNDEGGIDRTKVIMPVFLKGKTLKSLEYS